MARRKAIENFAPSWFATVMGTGILAVCTMMYSSIFRPLATLAYILAAGNVIIFTVLLVPWLGRWFLCRERAIADLRDPVVSNFYPTIAIGMLVLASDFIVILHSTFVAWIFWTLGTIGTVFFAFLTPYIVFAGDHVKIDHINPAWFIPPVGLIVIPIAGAMLASRVSGWILESLWIVCAFSWGSGFFLYISLLAICMYRFILHRPLPEVLAPTIWINLGPIGAGTIALLSMNSGFSMFSPEVLSRILTLFWGFGMWWFVMAILLTLHYIKKLNLPYALSWWAFIFPLGAYTGATYMLSQASGNVLLIWLGFILYIILLALWCITSLKTVEKMIGGEIL